MSGVHKSSREHHAAVNENEDAESDDGTSRTVATFTAGTTTPTNENENVATSCLATSFVKEGVEENDEQSRVSDQVVREEHDDAREQVAWIQTDSSIPPYEQQEILVQHHHDRQSSLSVEGDEDDGSSYDEEESSESVMTTSSFDSYYSSYESDLFSSSEREEEQDNRGVERRGSGVIAIGIMLPSDDEQESILEDEEVQEQVLENRRSLRFKKAALDVVDDQEDVSELTTRGMVELKHCDDKLKTKQVASQAGVHQNEQLYFKKPSTERDLEAVWEAVAHGIAEKEHDEKRENEYAACQEILQQLERGQDEERIVKRRTSSIISSHGSRRPSLTSLSEKSEVGRRGSHVSTGEEDEDLEDQAMPGAFAIEGMETTLGRQDTGYDSGFDGSDLGAESEELSRSGSGSFGQQQKPLPEFEGELLLEPELVDGLVLNEDEIPPEESKVKLRLLEAVVVVGALAAIAVIFGVALGVEEQLPAVPDDTNNNTLVGWAHVGAGPLRPKLNDNNNDEIFFGSTVSLSADGSRLAVASPGWDSSPVEPDIGQVLVYDWNDDAGDWEQVGQDLIGPGPRTATNWDHSMFQTIALSRDGSRLAFASPDWSEGQVAILQEPNAVTSEWTLQGQNITGVQGEHGRFGSSVALSYTGTRVVVGSPFVGDDDVPDCGLVRVFQEAKNSSWQQLGQDLLGEGAFDLYGWSVALSRDGSRLAIGSPGSGVLGGLTGAVQVYRLDGLVWRQLGRTIRHSLLDRFGHSVSLSDDGQIVAIGDIERPFAEGGHFVGHVHIFEYVESIKDWSQMGKELVGMSPYDNYGYSVALSSNGLKVAVGSPRRNAISGSVPRGYINVYNFDGVGWKKQGGSISAERDDCNLGYSVSISANGSRVAAGAPLARFDGKYSDVGAVGVYQPV